MSDRTFPIWRFAVRRLRNGKFEYRTLYYYNGNFFYPMFEVPTEIIGKIRRLMRIFKKEHSELVRHDRSHPDYKTKIQLAMEQGAFRGLK